LPKIKKPPDKPLQQVVDMSRDGSKFDTPLLSNFDATVSARNLSIEMLGKHNEIELSERNVKRRRLVSWQDKATQPATENDIENITSKVNEDIIVKPYQVQLPPEPSGTQVAKPKYLSSCELVCAIS
jgi:hypothetical protein